jgi:DNA-binding NtrC family response regulator
MGYHNIQLFSTTEGLLREIHQQPSLVFLDHNLPDGKGLNVLKEVKSTYPFVNCVMVSGQATIGVAIESLKYGAHDYLLKGKDDNSAKLKKVIGECMTLKHPNESSNNRTLFGNLLNLF